MSQAKTKGVEVVVEAQFVEERSSSEGQLYFFVYEVQITNHNSAPVQLLTRHWIITDGSGRREEVRGMGVIGEQPRILPSETYSYNSFCPLPTEVGTMQGSYGMIDESGEEFDAAIAPFTLAVPYALN
ncbi:MAG: Co2+/Mg2+ efflux protein ApaG [Myxococcales bacterium]|nr:Co2+/Mg2+ efflux protein ApaG [Myxococcales bacterium]|tara:strand:- start:95 stop:478 length:384 start_codon:yes stop_codon:yes gene_type:complete